MSCYIVIMNRKKSKKAASSCKTTFGILAESQEMFCDNIAFVPFILSIWTWKENH